MKTRSDAELIAAIDNLDLEPIKFKLMDENEGKGWSLEKADFVETQYKRFLFLSGKYPSQSIVPTPDIDSFWHQHILDTYKYQADCDNVFGYFRHHFPYFGMRGEEDAQALQDAAASTRELYKQHFEEEMTSDGNQCTACIPRPSPPPTCSCGSSVSDVINRPTTFRQIPLSQSSWRI